MALDGVASVESGTKLMAQKYTSVALGVAINYGTMLYRVRSVDLKRFTVTN